MNVALNANQLLQISVPSKNRSIQCEARILWIGDDVIETSFPTRHQVRVPVEVDHVNVTIPREDGAYTLRCPVILVSKHGIALHKPADLPFERVQRREHVRMRTDLDCWVLTQKGAKPLRGTIRDLSMGGCLLEVMENLKPETRLAITVTVEGFRLVLEGKVLRCTLAGAPKGLVQRVGLQFTKQDENVEQTLRRVMYRLQQQYIQRLHMAKNPDLSSTGSPAAHSPVLVDSFLAEVSEEMARLATLIDG